MYKYYSFSRCNYSVQHACKVPHTAVLPGTILFTSEYMAYMYIYEYKYVYIYLYTHFYMYIYVFTYLCIKYIYIYTV